MANEYLENDELKEIIDDFILESRDLMEGAIQDLVTIETNPDAEILNRIFRGVHTVKGTSSFLGFSTLSTLAHRAEDILGKMRKGDFVPDDSVTDVLLNACDAIKALIEDIAVVGNDGQIDVSEIIQHLEEVNQRTEPGATVAEATPTSQVIQEPATEFQADETGKKTKGEGSPKAEKRSAAAGSEGSTKKPSKAKKVKETKAAKAIDIEKPALKESAPPSPQQVVDSVQAESIPDKVAKQETASGQAQKQAQPAAANKEEQTVRVDVKKLDELMNLVGELVLGKNRLMMVNNTMRNRTEKEEHLLDNLNDVTNYVEIITNDLQAAVMRARLVAVSKLFNKIPRLVRDLCSEFGKKVEIAIEGEETELDKSLIEALHDPLVHIIRNSLDHGIETPEERKEKGKEPKGHLSLKAYNEGNQVVIEIFDDGKGVNVGNVLKKVREKGLMDEAELNALSRKDAMNLIFIPGLSTAQKVTSVSGRGVGMDVVRKNIEKMNGQVYVDSEEDQWTRLIMKLPLTLAIMKALIVQVSNEFFAIPLSIVVELVKLQDTKVKTIDRNEVVVLRDRIIPLVNLGDVLDSSRDEQQDSSIIICNVFDKTIGLKVRSVIGQEEVVIKPLGEFLRQVKWVGGATIRGDGKVILILDIATIINGLNKHKSVAA
jgi:two-component system, chemotaxis family, sensor kinase CheA